MFYYYSFVWFATIPFSAAILRNLSDDHVLEERSCSLKFFQMLAHCSIQDMRTYLSHDNCTSYLKEVELSAQRVNIMFDALSCNPNNTQIQQLLADERVFGQRALDMFLCNRAQHGTVEEAMLWMDAGAQVDASSINSPLRAAVKSKIGQSAIIPQQGWKAYGMARFLISRGANIRAKDSSSGKSLLHDTAVWNSNEFSWRIAKLILDEHVRVAQHENLEDFINSETRFGRGDTPLELCLRKFARQKIVRTNRFLPPSVPMHPSRSEPHAILLPVLFILYGARLQDTTTYSQQKAYRKLPADGSRSLRLFHTAECLLGESYMQPILTRVQEVLGHPWQEVTRLRENTFLSHKLALLNKAMAEAVHGDTKSQKPQGQLVKVEHPKICFKINSISDDRLQDFFVRLASESVARWQRNRAQAEEDWKRFQDEIVEEDRAGFVAEDFDAPETAPGLQHAATLIRYRSAAGSSHLRKAECLTTLDPRSHQQRRGAAASDVATPCGSRSGLSAFEVGPHQDSKRDASAVRQCCVLS